MPESEDDDVTFRREALATDPDAGDADTGPATVGSIMSLPPTTPSGSTPFPAAIQASGSRFALGAVLGRGGMGEVRLAHDTRVDREVAVKLMRKDAARSPEAALRFLREARVQGRLDHPAVVPVHDLGVDEHGVPYFAMKRLTGTTLADVLDAITRDTVARDRWPRRLLLDRLVDVCLAVEFAHTKGVVHRDLKPSNIMLGDFGEAYVLDWGIARVADDTGAIRKQDIGSIDQPAEAGQTAAGALLGTPGFMAPEQIRGETIDARADVYALGCILFEILTLHPALPHGPDAFEATLNAKAHHPRERYPDADVPPELDLACARATAPRTADRTGSARELGAAIRAYLDGDRDLARRRELALVHAGAAERAHVSGDQGRADAMREAGRALAIDPACRPAQDLLGRLLLEPPAQPLAAVERTIEAERIRTDRVHIQTGARVYLAFMLFLPLLYLIGAQITPLVVLGGLIVLNAGLMTWVARRDQPIGNLGLIALAIHGVMLAFTGVLFGPLIVLPVLAVASVAAFSISPTFQRPYAIIGVHFLALAAPVVLEATGALPRTFSVDTGITLHPWAVSLDPYWMVILVLALSFAQVAATALMIDRFRRVQQSAQEELHLTKWHLAQLLPER